MKAIPIDVYDKSGNFVRIEMFDGEGKHIFDAHWDETDEQTSKNREEFRRWAYSMARRKGYVLYN
jgi:hypothetical protein